MRNHPHVYEVNALIFLKRLSKKYDRKLTLATIPEDEWQRVARMGFDQLWLMGVWQHSPASRQEALAIPELRQEYSMALPDWKEHDVVGSPYAIYDYALDPELGEREELAELKSKLNRQGVGLMLDFVPNHMARDHRSTLSHPEWFVQGNSESVKLHPDWFFSPGGTYHIAHGKDPYFPPWTDTAQVNFYSADMRRTLTDELLRIVELADGVRCDMAMLALNRVFEQTWGWTSEVHARPQSEFWPDAIRQAKERRKEVLLLGEAYWGLERELQHLGFDFTYDKVLYDRLVSSGPAEIRERLMMGDESYQRRMAHFIENHDEARAIVALGSDRSQAAAVVMTTVPGLRLFHDGQLEARRVRLPIQLAREPEEAPEPEFVRFYERLLKSCDAPALHEGRWTPLVTSAAWDGNESYRNLLAWSWSYGSHGKTVVVNYSPAPAQGRVKMPDLPSGYEQVELLDELSGERYTRDLDELSDTGLYVDLAPWKSHIFVREN